MLTIYRGTDFIGKQIYTIQGCLDLICTKNIDLNLKKKERKTVY